MWWTGFCISAAICLFLAVLASFAPETTLTRSDESTPSDVDYADVIITATKKETPRIERGGLGVRTREE